MKSESEPMSIIKNLETDTKTNNPDDFTFDQIKIFCSEAPTFDYTELGNAKRLPRLLEGNFHYIEATDKFVVFKEERWRSDENYTIIRMIDLLLDDLKADLVFSSKLLDRTKYLSETCKTEKEEALISARIKEINQHYKASQKKTAIQATIDLFKAQKTITLPIGTFDSKGHFIGCKNGVIDLRDGSLVKNDPSYKMMKSTNVEFKKDAGCPKFLQFLGEIFQGDTNVIEFIQLLAGQMLSGQPNKNKFPIFIGDGANGKSVLLDIFAWILGDYSEQTASDVFTEKRKDKSYYQAELVGKRLVTMNETERGDKLDGAMVKSVVDSGLISARSPYGKPFSFQPVFTPIMCTNYMPYVSQDPAIWRRLIIVPFTYTIPVESRDPNLTQDLIKNEASGIFNWMIKGAIEYFEVGRLNIPKCLEDIQIKYKKEFDNIGHFITECSDIHGLTSPDDNLRCRITELRSGYARWCKENGYYPLSTRQFRQELIKKGIEIYKGSGGHEFVRGIGLTNLNNKDGEMIVLVISDSFNFD